jgi:hypothetical protein
MLMEFSASAAAVEKSRDFVGCIACGFNSCILGSDHSDVDKEGEIDVDNPSELVPFNAIDEDARDADSAFDGKFIRLVQAEERMHEVLFLIARFAMRFTRLKFMFALFTRKKCKFLVQDSTVRWNNEMQLGCAFVGTQCCCRDSEYFCCRTVSVSSFVVLSCCSVW